MLRKTILFAALAFLCAPQICSADLFQFSFMLDGTQSATGSPGIGTATGTFDTVTGVMTLSGEFSGLNGTTTVAHVHGFADAPANAGILFGVTVTNGVSAGTFSGSGTIVGDDGAFSNTFAGRTYINIHSTTNGGGEIRGHVTNFQAIPEPASTGLLALLGVAAIGFRRRK